MLGKEVGQLRSLPVTDIIQNIDPSIGTYHYKLIPNNGTFKIMERLVVLGLEALRPQGKVSFIV
jgi:p-cumate 2,3-dioxygenase beta subunit